MAATMRLYLCMNVSRSLSLSKMFIPRFKRTSSLPVTPVVLSKSASAHGGSSAAPQTPTSKGRVQIARSLSVPINVKEASLKRMDSFFRVIPSTSCVKEGEVCSNASEMKHVMLMEKTYLRMKQFVGSVW